MGLVALRTPVLALADANPALHARLTTSHVALADTVATAQATIDAAGSGADLPDGSPCAPALDPTHPALADVSLALDAAQRDASLLTATVLAWLLSGGSRCQH
jgi:hypothetical protein